MKIWVSFVHWGVFSRSLPSDWVVGDQWFLKLRIREIENIFYFVENVMELKMFFKEKSIGHATLLVTAIEIRLGDRNSERERWGCRRDLFIGEKPGATSLLAIVLAAAKLSKSRAEPKPCSAFPWFSSLPRLQKNQWASEILIDIWSDERYRKAKLDIGRIKDDKNEKLIPTYLEKVGFRGLSGFTLKYSLQSLP